MINSPLVSISITTYNHALFLRKCLDSVLAQKTCFEYEIVIGEDCSTDDTLAICKEYQSKYSDKIRLIAHEKNVGLRENNLSVWSSCKGKYIAYLEGDDFWTSENKLQFQVDYLEKSSQFVASGHQSELWYSEDSLKNRLFSDLPDLSIIDFNQNIEKWLFATATLVYKNFFIDPNLEKLKLDFLKDKMFWSDRPLMVLLSLYGDFIYHDKNWACWRQHEKNMTKIGNSARMNEEGGKAYAHLQVLYPQKRKKIAELTLRWYLLAARDAFINKDYHSFCKYERLAFKNVKGWIHTKNFIKCTCFILIGKSIY